VAAVRRQTKIADLARGLETRTSPAGKKVSLGILSQTGYCAFPLRPEGRILHTSSCNQTRPYSCATSLRWVSRTGEAGGAQVFQTNLERALWTIQDCIEYHAQAEAIYRSAGLIFLNATAGAASRALIDVGINWQFMKEFSATLIPGSSILFVLIRRTTPYRDRVLEELKGTGGKILKTSLAHEDETKLQAALSAAR
jgi:hypothetical protein